MDILVFVKYRDCMTKYSVGLLTAHFLKFYYANFSGIHPFYSGQHVGTSYSYMTNTVWMDHPNVMSQVGDGLLIHKLY